MATTHTPPSAVSSGITPGAHIADPAPLGLAAFALTTFVLSVVNAGWVPATVEPVVFGLALAYGGAAKGVGLYLLAWGLFTGYMTVAATRVSTAVLAVFGLLTLTFLVLAWGEFASSGGIHKAGGYLGILTALAAWYASFAGVVAFSFKRPLVPTGAHATH